jgi:hypothetical protein
VTVKTEREHDILQMGFLIDFRHPHGRVFEKKIRKF